MSPRRNRERPLETFRGYTVQRLEVPVGARRFTLLAPCEPERLLDDPRVVARFAEDEYMPYWATLWPAALVLADAVADWPPVPPGCAAPRVLELGCGLGLVGLVAAARGYNIVISDYDDDALAFTCASARENGLPEPAVRRVDWRETYADLRPDRIVAADVLYEARHLEPIARFVAAHLAPGGEALVSDANRTTADRFPVVAAAAGLRSVVEARTRPGLTADRPVAGRIFRLARAT